MPMFKGATHWKIWQLHFFVWMRVPLSPNLRCTTRLNTHLQDLQYAAAKSPFKLPKQTWETWGILCKFFIHDNNRKNATMSCQFVAVSVGCGCHPILTVSKDCCLCWSTVLWITVVRYTQPPRRVFRGADGRRAFGIQVALVLATKIGCSYLEPAQPQGPQEGQTLARGRQTRWKAWVRWFRFGM